jgi:hypothetical protein
MIDRRSDAIVAGGIAAGIGVLWSRFAPRSCPMRNFLLQQALNASLNAAGQAARPDYGE